MGNSLKEIFDKSYRKIESILLEQGNKSLRDIKNKILDSQMGVFVSEYNTNAHPIEQTFLDINEKSQILEREDIFKGHCFKNYDDDKVIDLKKDWAKLKKYGAQFIKKMNFEDFGHFIYLYFLITESNKIKENLYDQGKHMLEGKTMDETDDILQRMIVFGKSNSEFFEQLRNQDYYFEDCCKDYRKYKNTLEHQSLKEVCFELLSDSRALYQKLPLYYFIYYLNLNPEMISNIKYVQFKRILSNIFIAGTIFVYSSGRKSKSI